MKIYLINLDTAPERLAFVDGQLSRLNLDYQRVAALTPQTIPERLRLRFHEQAADLLLPGEIACFASHLRIAELLLDSPEPHCLVLEDDVEFECAADELRDLERLSARFDILHLSRSSERPALLLDTVRDRRVLRYLDLPYGTGAYFLTRNGAKKLLRHALGVAIPFDIFLRREAFLHLDIASIAPSPVPQDRFGASGIDEQSERGAKAQRKQRRRSFYESTERAAALRRTLRMVRSVGALNYARMRLARFAMKATGRHHRRTEPLVLGEHALD